MKTYLLLEMSEKYKNLNDCHSERSEETSYHAVYGFFTSFRMTFFQLFLLILFLCTAVYCRVYSTSPVKNYPVNSSAIGFLENKGQIIDQSGNPNTDVLYLYKSKNLKVQIKKNSFSYEVSDIKRNSQLYIHRIDINLIGANPDAEVIAEGKSQDYNNYYLSNSSGDGINYAHHYKKVIYKNIYPNIDLVFYVSLPLIPSQEGTLNTNIEPTHPLIPSQEGTLNIVKYDFIVHPGGKVSDIKMKYAGADGLSLNDRGVLKIQTSLGNLEEHIPLCYSINNNNQIINAKFNLNDDVITFNVSKYNKNHTLVIDPSLTWATYYGGIEEDKGQAVASDNSNNIYVAGITRSGNAIATLGAHQIVLGGNVDAFLIKFNSAGERLWGTYYGGALDESSCYGIATDINSNVIITGETNSINNISTAGSHQPGFGGGSSDAFIAKFNSDGFRQWGTYYGGEGDDRGLSVTTDGSGNIIATGMTSSDNVNNVIATVGSHQFIRGGSNDAFVVKFNSAGVRQWGTYYGGMNDDIAYDIATDIGNNICIAGTTYSPNGTNLISTPGAHQVNLSGTNDALLVKFNPAGARQWGTYYGGTGNEDAYGVATDASSNVIIAGQTSSTSSIATNGAYQTIHAGGTEDGFIAKFNTTGTRQWGTYYGGSLSDIIYGVATDGNGNIAVAGKTYSTSGIASNGDQQTTFGGNYDAFVSKFSPAGSRSCGTYFGGTDADAAEDVVFDSNGNIIIAGWTASTTAIATDGSFQQNFGGGTYDAYVAKYGGCPITIITNSITGPFCADENSQISFTVNTNFNSGNIFTAQLSSPNGDFSNPYTLGTLTGTTSGTINIHISKTTIEGYGYRIRVVGSNPIISGTDNGTNITINRIPDATIASGPLSVCEKNITTYNASVDNSAANRWVIDGGTVIGSSTDKVVNVQWGKPGFGSVKLVRTIETTGCRDSVKQNVLINPLPKPNINGNNSICYNSSSTYTTVPPDGTTNKWYVDGGTIIASSISNAAEVQWTGKDSGFVRLVQTITSTGCKDSTDLKITINPLPVMKIDGDSVTCFINGYYYFNTSNEDSITNEWFVTQGSFFKQSNYEIFLNWKGSGKDTIKLVRTNRLTLCKDSIIKELIVYPLPKIPDLIGPLSVCPQSISTYTLSFTEGNVYSKWHLIGGQILDSLSNSKIKIKWGNSGQGSIHLQFIDSITGCINNLDKNIKIQSLPKPVIIGAKNVCSNCTESYFPLSTDGTQNKWYVQGGQIIGSDSSNTVQITWGVPGAGNIKLIQKIIGSDCKDSSEIVINISDQPVNGITGDTSVCQNDIGTYSVPSNPDLTNEWQITGGDFLSPTNENLILVQWKRPGKGSLKLIQTGNEDYKDSLMLDITIHPLPPKPVITRLKDTLYSSAPIGNHWYLEGFEISGDNPFHPYTYGNYTVMVIDSIGCYSEMSDPYFYSSNSVGISKNSYIKIYPNPAENQINFSIIGYCNKNINIQLFNLLGVVQKSYTVFTYDDNYVRQFDISNLSDGIYILKIQIGTEQQVEKLIIKR